MRKVKTETKVITYSGKIKWERRVEREYIEKVNRETDWVNKVRVEWEVA